MKSLQQLFWLDRLHTGSITTFCRSLCFCLVM